MKHSTLAGVILGEGFFVPLPNLKRLKTVLNDGAGKTKKTLNLGVMT